MSTNIVGICESCYEMKDGCVYVWLSPKGRKDCTHPGAPIKLCGNCRERRKGTFQLANTPIVFNVTDDTAPCK